MENIPFTYRVKCVNTNEYYYGVKYAKNCKPSDLWSSYFTSSNKVKELILIHGKDNFIVEIRKVFDNSEDAIKWEQNVNYYTMNWPNYLNSNCGKAFSKEACIKGAISFAEMYPELKSETSRKAGIKSGKINKKNKTGMFHDKNIQSKAGKKGGKKTKDTGLFQTDKWRKLASRSDYIWFTNGINNKRIHVKYLAEFELNNPTWKKGLFRKNLKMPNNKGRVCLHSHDNEIKRFVHLNSEIYLTLIKQGYYRKNEK